MARHNTRGKAVFQDVSDSMQSQRQQIAGAMRERMQGAKNAVRFQRETSQQQLQARNERMRASNEQNGRG